jgi:hypothetical protein
MSEYYKAEHNYGKKYLVIVSTPDGGGMNAMEKDYWFECYDDAHEFYIYIKSLEGKVGFYPSIHTPPTLAVFPLPKTYKKGDHSFKEIWKIK